MLSPVGQLSAIPPAARPGRAIARRGRRRSAPGRVDVLRRGRVGAIAWGECRTCVLVFFKGLSNNLRRMERSEPRREKVREEVWGGAKTEERKAARPAPEEESQFLAQFLGKGRSARSNIPNTAYPIPNYEKWITNNVHTCNIIYIILHNNRFAIPGQKPGDFGLPCYHQTVIR